MAISRKAKEGYWVTDTKEFCVDLEGGKEALRVEFQDGSNDPAYVIDLGASTNVTVKTRAELDAIHAALDAGWEHWTKVEKKGKA